MFLSGGTSQIKNIENLLRDELGIETVKNPLAESELKINPDLHDRIPVITQGIGVGIRAVTSLSRHSKINLRKGQFAYVQDYESVLKNMGTGFKALATFIFLLCGSYIVNYFLYSEKLI